MKQFIKIKSPVAPGFNKKLVVFLAMPVAFMLFYFLLPGKLFKDPASYVLEDAQGNLLNASIAKDGQWRFPYNEDVPPKFITCITSFEDKRFYKHPGLDGIAMARAVQKNIAGTKQGGSTLSMQVIRLSLKNNERNIGNKLKEILLALRMECSYSKKQIMAMYASYAPFGSNVVGLDAASWRYFGRSAAKLSWAEMAMLAVLPNAPSLIHPGKNRNALLKKRNRLLMQLKQEGKISAEDYQLSLLEPLPEKPLPLPQHAPHLLQRIAKEHTSGSFKTRSTLQIDLQKQVNNILKQRQQQFRANGINNICALVLDVQTGNTLAYTGNTVEGDLKSIQGDVDIIQAARSPGSTLKPFLYVGLLSDGIILPHTLIPDIPTQVGGYTPQNFDKQYDGAVPASQAISRSLNIPAVRMLQQYKYQRFYETLEKIGIKTLNKPAGHYGLSMILGGCEVNMWQLAGAYASMARILNNDERNNGKVYQGTVHEPTYTFKKIEKGEVIDFPFDATSIYYTFLSMQEVMRPGEEGLWQQFNSSQKIAWKTGTSFGFRDGWAIGVSPANIVAVWVGNADGEGRAGLIGVQTAAPVLFDIFRLLPAVSWFKKPAYNYTYLPVCRQSGFRANTDCPYADTMHLPPQAAKSITCPYHKIIHLDKMKQYQVTADCENTSMMQHVSWFILPPAMEFYYRQRNHDYRVLPPFGKDCIAVNKMQPMEIIYPQPGSKIYVPVEITGTQGKTIFVATHRNKHAKLFWSLDKNVVATTSSFHQIALSPAAGRHSITVTDEMGNSLTRHFEILSGK